MLLYKKNNPFRRLFSTAITVAFLLGLVLAFPPSVIAAGYTLGTAVPFNSDSIVVLDQSGWYYIEAWGGNGGDGAGFNGGKGGESVLESGYFYFEAGDTIYIQVGMAGERGGYGASNGTGGVAGTAGTGTWFGSGYLGGSGGNVTRGALGIIGSGGYGGGGGGAASGVLLNGTNISNIIIASGGGGGGGGEGGNVSSGQHGADGGGSDSYGAHDVQASNSGDTHSTTNTNGYIGDWVRHDGESIHVVNIGIGYGGGGAGGGGGGWNGTSGGGGQSGSGGKSSGVSATSTEGGGGAAGGQSNGANTAKPAYITDPGNSTRTSIVNGQIYITFLGGQYEVAFDDASGNNGAEDMYSPASPWLVNAYLNGASSPYLLPTTVDTPTRLGYNFDGYWCENNNVQYYDENGNCLLNWDFWKNITLTALWTPLEYVTTYHGNGATSGTVPTDTTHYMINDVVTVLGRGDLIKTGYTFTGWSNGTSIYTPGQTFIITANTELTATWEPNYSDSYWKQVTYHGNGATSGTVPTDTTHYMINDVVTVLGRGDLIKTGYTFTGWNTAANGTGETYTANDILSITSNVILYAHWQLIPTPANTTDDSWPILNLILCILGGLLAVLTLIRALFWSKNKEQERYIEKNGISPFWLILTVILAIIGIVVFIRTEDMRLTMAIVDVWTIANASIFLLGLLSMRLTFKKGKRV